jgi:phospholipase/carboxylesterase
MPRFFRRLAEGVFDFEDVARRAAELATWLDAAISHYALNPASLTAVGFSNGANIAAAMLLLKPPAASPLRSAILIRAMVPIEPTPTTQPSPPAPVRTLILAGLRDPIVPAENSRRLAAMLSAQRAEVTLKELDSAHELTREDITLAQAWLKADPSPRTLA